MSNFDLVTIARQFGAGGSELAAALGKTLGWSVLDRDIIHTAAEMLDADHDQAKGVDEYVAGALQRFMNSFAFGTPDFALEPAYEVDADALARATHEVARRASKSVPIIIVGHGVQCLFAGRPHTLHVRVVAPVDLRAARIAERQRMTREAALEEVQRRDRERARYLKHHFEADNNEPTLYSVQFNTAQLSVPRICEAIARLVER